MPNESIVDQFTAQVERFVRSAHVNETEPVARFVAAVAPRETEEALDVAISRLAIHHIPDAGAALREMARVIRPDGRIGLFDITTSEDVAEAAYHNEVERLRDPSHASALPLSELFRLIGRARLDADRLDTMDYELEVEDWISRAEQSPEQARGARERIAAALGTRRFGGKRVRRDAERKQWFTVRWAIITARKPGG
jgi:SAM-dependent methyltransferase